MGQLKMKPWFLASQRTLQFKKKKGTSVVDKNVEGLKEKRL